MATFTIVNEGYKEVFIVFKKPINIPFEFEIELDGNSNRMTKLRNKLEVRILYKSRKPITFSVVLEVENNFGKKYELKLHGTTSKSHLLNCDSNN